jgi:hypothetical protein
VRGQPYAAECGPRRRYAGGCAQYVPKFRSLINGHSCCSLDAALGFVLLARDAFCVDAE